MQVSALYLKVISRKKYLENLELLRQERRCYTGCEELPALNVVSALYLKVILEKKILGESGAADAGEEMLYGV